MTIRCFQRGIVYTRGTVSTRGTVFTRGVVCTGGIVCARGTVYTRRVVCTRGTVAARFRRPKYLFCFRGSTTNWAAGGVIQLIQGLWSQGSSIHWLS